MNMKQVSMVNALLASAMVCGMAACVSAEVVAYWPFGTNGLNDASGKGHTLENAGVDVSGTRAVFNGSHTKFNTVGTLDLSAYSNLTVECFARRTDPNDADGRFLFEHSSGAVSYPGAFRAMWTGTNSTAPCAFESFWNTGTGGGNMDLSWSVTPDGRWHHVALVHDVAADSANLSRLYIDGVQAGSSSAVTSYLSLTNATFFIGSRNNDSYKFNGQLDDIRITDRALSPEEFMSVPSTDYAADGGLAPRKRAVAYWPFKDGVELTDATGNGNALTNSGVVFSKGAAVFGGSHSVFSTATNMPIKDYVSLTIECFLKTVSPTVPQMLVELSDNYNNYTGCFVLDMDTSAGRVYGGMRMKAAGTYNAERTADGVATNGQWHHVAFVIDASKAGADRAQLFFDRVRQTTHNNLTNDAMAAFASKRLYIGSRGDSLYRFKGQIDDVRISAGALTTNEFLQARSEPKGTLIRMQ